jgi:hypothetical protein
MSKIPFLDPAWLKAGLVDTSGDAGSSGQILSSTGSGVNWINQGDITSGQVDKALSLTLQVKNTESVALTKGQVVCAAPTATPPSGNVIEVKLADNDGTDSMPAIGILNEGLDAAGGENDEGEAIMFGRISGIDTSAFSVGDEVFVSDTAGALIATKPTGVKYIQKVGVVMRDDASNGTIEVFGAGRTNDVPTPLYIDHTNQRLGIGTASPGAKLEVAGTGELSFKINNTQHSRSLIIEQGGGYSHLKASHVSGIAINYGQGNPGILSLFNNTTQAVKINTNGNSYLNGGNVGIGTTSPTHLLTLETASSPGLKIKDTTQGATLLAFSQDSNSHIGTYSSHPLVLDTNSSERMRITSGGNVGIGTDSPISKLEISQQLSAASTIDYPYTISSRDDGNSINQLGGEGVGIKFRVAGNDATDPGNSLVGASIAAIRESSSDSVSNTGLGFFVTQNDETLDEAVRIDSAGNVGIGTTSPGAKLQVNGGVLLGSAYVQPAGSSWTTSNSQLILGGAHNTEFNDDNPGVKLLISGYNNDGTTLYPIYVEDENGLPDFWLKNRPSGTGLPTAYFAGNVGIGTTSPSHDLTINSATGGQLQFQYNTLSRLRIEADSGGGSYYAAAGFYHRFFTSGAERMRIDSSGNVGIGTTSPSQKIEVSGSVNNNDIAVLIKNNYDDNLSTSRPAAALLFSTASNNGYLRVYGAPADTAANHQIDLGSTAGGSYLTFSPSGSEKMRIEADGSIIFNDYGSGSNTGTVAYNLAVDSSGNIIENSANTRSVFVATSTASGYNINTTTTISWNSEDIKDSGYTHSNSTNNDSITITQAGTYKIYAAITYTTAVERANVALQILVNGTATGARGAGGYVRSQSGHSDGTTIVEDYVTLSANDVIKIQTSQEAAAGTVNLISGESKIIIEKLTGLTLSTTNANTLGGLGATDFVQVSGDTMTGDLYLDDGDGATPSLYFKNGANNFWRYLMLSGGDFSIKEGTSTRLTFQAGGNVGIGTTSPSRKLDVRGDAQILSTGATGLRIVGGNTDEVYMIFGDADDNSMGGFGYDNNTNELSIDVNNSEAIRIDSSGNVGIGATNPENILHLKSPNPYLILEDTSNANKNRIANVDGNMHYHADYNNQMGNSRHIFYIDNSEKLRINTNGNVGIGTTSPGKKLDVAGEIQGTNLFAETYRSARTDGDIYIQAATATDFVSIGTQVSPNLMRIDGSGNVGIGTTSPAAKLEVAGNSILDKKSILRLPGMSMGSGGITDEYLVIARKYDGVNQNATGIIGKIIFSRGGTTAGNNPSEYYINIQCAYNSDALNSLTYTGSEIFTSLDVVDISGTDYYALKVRSNGGGDTSDRFYAEGLLMDDGDSNIFTRVRSSDASVTVVSTGSMTPTVKINGSGTANYVTKWSDTDTITNSTIYDNGTNVGIGTTSPSHKFHVSSGNGDTTHTIHVAHTRNDPDTASNAVFIDANYSGTKSAATDIIQTGLKVDLDSSATGTATDEHRVYGIHSDTRNSGFADFVFGTYSYAESNYTGGKTANLGGVYGLVAHDANSASGGVTNLFGVKGVAQIQDDGDVDNAYGGQFQVLIANNRDANVDVTVGVEAEIQIDEQSALTYGDIHGFRAIIDNNEGAVPTFGNQYLFKGDYQGTKGSNAYGIYIEGDKHYFDGNVGIGTTSPDLKLHLAHSDSNNGLLLEHTSQANGFQILQNIRETEGLIWQKWTNGSFTSNLMTLDYSGNVGIGTTSPQQKLDVNGDIAIKTATQLSFNTSNGTLSVGGHAGQLDLLSSSIFINYTGDVGIGTTNPGAKLDVEGGAIGSAQGDSTTAAIFRAGRQNLYFENQRTAAGSDWNNNTFKILAKIDTTSHQSIDFVNDASYNEHIDIYTGNQSFNTRFAANGNVGIGDTAPGAKLTVFRTDNSYAINLSDTESRAGLSVKSSGSFDSKLTISSGASSRQYIQAVNNAATTGRDIAINPYGGNVGIGTTSPGEKLTISGGNLLVAGDYQSLYVGGKTDSSQDGIRMSIDNAGNGYFDHRGSGLLHFRVDSSTGATSRMVINSSGNVGIGTTNPTAKLGIHQAANNGNTGAFTNTHLKLSASATADGSGFCGITAATSTANNYGYSFGAQRTSGGVGDFKINYHNNSASGTNRFLIDQNGNVGIGTTNPDGLLNLKHTSSSSSVANDATAYALTLNFEGATGDYGRHIAIRDASGQAVAAIGGYDEGTVGATGLFFATGNATTAAQEVMMIDSSGNVGIGTTNPSRQLEVSNTGDSIIRIAGDSDNDTGELGDAVLEMTTDGGGQGWTIRSANVGGGTGDFKVNTFIGGTESNKLLIDRDGNVGIGTTSPSEKLHISSSDQSTARIRLSNTNTGSGGDNIDLVAGVHNVTQDGFSVYNATSNQTQLVIQGGGNVGIGTSTPSYKLDVAGTIRATGDVIAYSDVRVKENIKTIDNSLEKVNQLRGVEFNKIGEDKKSIGVIAQEIEKILPEVVRQDDKGMKSVAYGNITAVLIEAIKEQQKQIDELKNKLNAFTK